MTLVVGAFVFLKIKSQHYENITSLGRLNRLAEKLYHANPLNKKKIVMDIGSDDVQSLLAGLNRFQVKYLLVGGMAGVVHGHIRTTQNMDLWVKNDKENSNALIQALLVNEVAGADLLYGMPLIFGCTSVRFGLSGFELDLGHSLQAFVEADYDASYARSLHADFDGIPFQVIGLEDLIKEKATTARPKDLADLEELQQIWESQL